MNIYPFNMKKVDMVVALLHITSLVFVTTVDAHTVSTHVAPSHLNESLLRATGANYIEHNATHLSLYSPPLRYGSSAYDHVWPALEFNWRVVVGSIIAFIGGSLGCAGGIGGGGIFVPMLVLVIGFDEKSSTALSKCMIMGASAASVLFNFGLKSSLIDYDLALVFQPMLMLGISIGVIFNVIFPNWIVTILLLVLFTGTALTTFIRAVSLYKKETIEKLLDKEERSANCQVSSETDLENTECIDLEPFDAQNSNSMKRHWKSFVALGYVWISFLVLQIVKNYTTSCSSYYWLWNILQVPVAASVFFTKSIQLFIGNKKNNDREVEESLIPAPTQFKWTFPIICVCAAAGLLAGTVGGLLGLGGGFIIGPLFLELGFTPEVASATASFIMLFSSSMSVLEYYLLHRFPLPFALYLFTINAVAAIWTQAVFKKLLNLLGRASVIVFILSFAIFLSAICLGGYGINDSIASLREGAYMGFLNLCS